MSPEVRKLIVSFFSPRSKLTFYASAVDGTLCAAWVDGGIYYRATVRDLHRRIKRHKRGR
jgi:hypothetical protein